MNTLWWGASVCVLVAIAAARRFGRWRLARPIAPLSRAEIVRRGWTS